MMQSNNSQQLASAAGVSALDALAAIARLVADKGAVTVLKDLRDVAIQAGESIQRAAHDQEISAKRLAEAKQMEADAGGKMQEAERKFNNAVQYEKTQKSMVDELNKQAMQSVKDAKAQLLAVESREAQVSEREAAVAQTEARTTALEIELKGKLEKIRAAAAG